ncbi:molybdenum cofactor biosynthesis protein C [Sphingorhabdus lutea]|uniref:Cyclic pyranopterin monophosphate synthase n=1 Tax=Sphingorhabdus lutea TaxID=1913578 RepID=A0A1L3J8W0_9SPHN|nr:cyclic pyranopterin monophosphate synthase MoaC [Sphingorhabdus lutea]APG61576.1 molybdenum cofactor biosynthesis protein C [Sphingorhabdus lutea]
MADILTHFDEDGRAQMVDISAKQQSQRVAIAQGRISMSGDAFSKITSGRVKKGDVISIAELAGIMAAKRTSDLIPLCHPLMLNKVQVKITPAQDEPVLIIQSTVKISGQTGVEMEALTAVSIAALTIYDMVKAIDKSMIIGPIKLVHKSGGKSGDFNNDDEIEAI